jgi:hypothetical protein
MENFENDSLDQQKDEIEKENEKKTKEKEY